MAGLHEDNEQNPDVRESLRTRRQIETNDPTLEMLEMGDDGYLPPDGVWARDGSVAPIIPHARSPDYSWHSLHSLYYLICEKPSVLSGRSLAQGGSARRCR